MPESRKLDQITCKPGITRDSTPLDSDTYIDGQWVRFWRGRPKKMGGYRELTSNIDTVPRAAYVACRGGLTYVYAFTRNKAWTTAISGLSTSVALSTTFPDLADEDAYTYTTNAVFDALGSATSLLLVHPAKNLADPTSEVNTPIYSTTRGVSPTTFVKLTDPDEGVIQVSGGVVVLQPFVFAYGNNGLIKNSDANNPNGWKVSLSGQANEVNVAASKIVRALPLQGGAASPAGLFWSLDSLIRVSRAGGDFRYDTLSTQTTVLSPASIVEYNNVFYWIGADRFLMFDGNVKELPNQQNLVWFFDNLNQEQRSKVWGYRNTKYGEIWWFFPTTDNTECDHAIIYNVREGTWYDTRHARSAGHSCGVFPYPIALGSGLNSGDKYSAFVEDVGLNAVENGQELAIQSYFETNDIGYPTGGADGEKPVGSNHWTRLSRVEPDFAQRGIMNLIVRGREFANSEPVQEGPYVFDSTTERVDLRAQYRHLTLRMESNTLHGDYQMGRVILHTETGDVRS